ncbi:MAG TPA: hypothetical protein PLK47_11430 [Plasticicumulans sp.]|nr:hypothetical protein [Plasticicumulans sp.]
MDADLARKLLDVLIDNASRILLAGFGVNWTESTFFDVVRLLRHEASLKSYFLDRTRETLALPDPGRLDAGTVPPELIELVAHEFRWPEFLQLASERVDNLFGGDTRLAVGDIASRLPEAFDDAWRDREFYERYMC